MTLRKSEILLRVKSEWLCKYERSENTYGNWNGVRRMHDAEGAQARSKREERRSLGIRADDACSIRLVGGGDNAGSGERLGYHSALLG